MLAALSATLREALSAFLVVAVVLAYVSRAHLSGLRNAIRWGIGLSIPITSLAAALFAGAENQALWEGVLSLTASVAVGWVARYLWRLARLRTRVPGVAGRVAVCVVTILLIVRGGIEIALLLGTMVWHVPALETVVGAALGPLLAIALGLVWSRAARHVPQRLAGQITAIFLLVLCVHLLIDGLHETSEADLFPGADTLHAASESLSSEGTIGRYTPYLLLAAPMVWWLVAIFWEHGKATTGRGADVDR
jgi:FTR1 family protein